MLIAVVVLLVLPGAADAAPPSCGTPPELTMREGRTLHIDLLYLCQDADLDTLTFVVVTQPAHGTLAGPTAAGGVLYEPVDGFVGSDSFSFKAHDATAESATITVQIAVAANQPPACASSLAADVEPGTASFIDPFYELDGCDDPDDYELSVAVVDPPQHGTATAEDYYFRYQPTAGYSGPDSFTYRASDGTAESNLATMHITVLPPNRPPTCAPATALRATPGESLPLDHHAACSDPDGDAIFPVLVVGPGHGILSLPTDTILYTPDAGYVGLDRIVFLVEDDRGASSNVSTLTITVGLPPGPPPIPPPPATQPDDRVAPAINATAVVGQKLRRLRANGLRLVLQSSEPAMVSFELTVDKATARRLGLKRKPGARVVVGSLRRAVLAGSTTVTVRLTSAARRALRPARSVTLRLDTVATDAAGNRRERVRTIAVKR